VRGRNIFRIRHRKIAFEHVNGNRTQGGTVYFHNYTKERNVDTGEAGERGKLRSFINLYDSPNIITLSKSRRLRWAGHVECAET
jgi:hypothetical protein